MGRVINTDSTGKQRNQSMRTGAELLRRLSQKAGHRRRSERYGRGAGLRAARD